MPAMTSKHLTPKQLAFCKEYIIDFNGTAAYIRAGYSKKGAKTGASRLLANVNIQAELQRQKNKRSKRTEITADRVLEELANVGFASLKDAMTWGKRPVEMNGKVVGHTVFVEFKDSDDLPPEVAAMLSEVKVTHTQAGSTLSMKTHDKMRALDKLALHTGILKEGADGEDDATPIKASFTIRPAKEDVTVTRGT